MTNVEMAIQILKNAFANDPDYAHTWHCNIAAMFHDALCTKLEDIVVYDLMNELANEGASRTMRACFDVNTTNDMLDPISTDCAPPPPEERAEEFGPQTRHGLFSIYDMQAAFKAGRLHMEQCGNTNNDCWDFSGWFQEWRRPNN